MFSCRLSLFGTAFSFCWSADMSDLYVSKLEQKEQKTYRRCQKLLATGTFFGWIGYDWICSLVGFHCLILLSLLVLPAVRYPDNLGGPVSIAKAQEVLRWSPTTLTKALRSVARFYERIMLENEKHKAEIESHGRVADSHPLI